METFQVFLLCVTIIMFLAWVMVLKKQIIALFEENKKLKEKLRDKVVSEIAGTSVKTDQPVWARKS